MTSSSSAAVPRAAPWPTGCPPTRRNRVLVLEAGRPDYIWDPFIHMPAALTFPIGNRFYDWKYESEPEPHMNGRRIYHARGKVLGGSSSINGMIFQRGNPLDYERWAADPGMADVGLRALPAVLQADGELPGADADDPFRGHDGPLVLERGPGRPTRCSRRSSRRCSRPATRSPTTSTATGRRASPRSTATSTAAGGCQRRPGLPAPGDGPAEPDGARPGRYVTRILFEGTRAVGVEYPARGARRKRVTAGEVILCGGAINSPQLLQLSGVGNAAELSGARHRRGAPTCPAWARTCRTTWRCTSSTPAS